MTEQAKASADSADHGQSKRVQTGYVVSDRMDKTAVVAIERRTQHGLYKKYIRRSTRLKVHDAGNACSSGDFVEISETRPHAKSKAWVLERVLSKAVDPQTTG